MSEAGPGRTERPGRLAGEGSTASGGRSEEESVRPGIQELLGRLAASVASAVDTRVQLAALEFAEERSRARDRLVLILLAAIAGAFALLGANALAVVLLWDHLGWGGLLLLTVLWLAIAGVAAWRLSLASRREQRPFAATLAEFGRDRAFIAERFEKRSR